MPLYVATPTILRHRPVNTFAHEAYAFHFAAEARDDEIDDRPAALSRSAHFFAIFAAIHARYLLIHAHQSSSRRAAQHSLSIRDG